MTAELEKLAMPGEGDLRGWRGSRCGVYAPVSFCIEGGSRSLLSLFFQWEIENGGELRTGSKGKEER